MKSASTFVGRIVVAVARPLDRALRESERLMAPQMDAGCSPFGPADRPSALPSQQK